MKIQHGFTRIPLPLPLPDLSVRRGGRCLCGRRLHVRRYRGHCRRPRLSRYHEARTTVARRSRRRMEGGWRGARKW